MTLIQIEINMKKATTIITTIRQGENIKVIAISIITHKTIQITKLILSTVLTEMEITDTTAATIEVTTVIITITTTRVVTITTIETTTITIINPITKVNINIAH